MSDLHVLIGTADNDVRILSDCAQDGSATSWIVPKTAVPRDGAMFFVQGAGIIATGAIQSIPKRETKGKWAGRYRAMVADIAMLDPPLSQEELSQAIPSWAWLRYPKMYTTPADEVADLLRELVAPSDAYMEEVDLKGIKEGETEVHPDEPVTARQPMDLETLLAQLDRNSETGQRGEHAVLNYEQARLRNLEPPCWNPSAFVKQLSLVDVTAGYDIESSWPGHERKIEVKATTSSGSNFFLTENERQTLKSLGPRAWLYRVVLLSDGRTEVRELQDPIRHLENCMTPQVWRVKEA